MLVDDGRADRGRRLARAARDAREARERLEQEILPRAVAVGTRLAVPGGGDVDEPRVPGPGRFPAQAETLHHARSEVLDQDVRTFDEAPRDGVAVGMLEVQGQAPLVPVRGEKEGADAVQVEVAAGPVPLPERPPRGLDLDHVGAEVRDELDARGAEQELREARHPDARQHGERRPPVHWRSALEKALHRSTRLLRSIGADERIHGERDGLSRSQ